MSDNTVEVPCGACGGTGRDPEYATIGRWKPCECLGGKVRVTPEAMIEALLNDEDRMKRMAREAVSMFEDVTGERLPDGDGFDCEVMHAVLRAALEAGKA